MNWFQRNIKNIIYVSFLVPIILVALVSISHVTKWYGISINNPIFRDWVDLVDPLVSLMGVESGDLIGHKRFLAFFSGGMLPLISLSFLHMLVKFEEEEKNKKKTTDVDIEELSKIAGKIEKENYDKDLIVNMPSKEEIDKAEEILLGKKESDQETKEQENIEDEKVKRLVYTK